MQKNRSQAQLLDFTHTSPPAFVVLATDGYPDAVGGVEKFVERVGVFYSMLRKEGVRGFEASMQRHLDEVSPHLFDDTTVGFLVRSDFTETGVQRNG